MSQVTIYMDDEAISRAKASAAAQRLSLSAWVARLIKEQTPAVDDKGYPLGFFENAANNAAAWSDFPLGENLRDQTAPDVPREAW